MKSLVIAMAALVAATPALAAATCADGPTYEIGQCLAKELKKAEIDLSYAYSKASDAMEFGPAVGGATNASRKARLAASQRAFLAYRTAQCRGLVSEMWSGGSGQGNAIASCEIELTLARIKQLGEIQ